jgi:hypothetical protein
LSCVAVGCDVDPSTQSAQRPVIGGAEVAADDLRSVGVVRTNLPSICTGSLITPHLVLTAAHCVEPEFLRAVAHLSGGEPPASIRYEFSFARDANNAAGSDWLAVLGATWHEGIWQRRSRIARCRVWSNPPRRRR